MTPRHWEGGVALANGLGAVVLAWFTFDSIGAAGAALAWAELWSLGLLVSGIGAVVLGLVPAWRSEMTWTLTGTVMATAMIGRGLDILARVDEFAGRPELAVSIWLVMGVATAITWMVVGAMTEALEDAG
jgi:hypothetical protein